MTSPHPQQRATSPQSSPEPSAGVATPVRGCQARSVALKPAR